MKPTLPLVVALALACAVHLGSASPTSTLVMTGRTSVSGAAAKKAAFTLVYLYNRVSYKTRPARLRPGLVSFTRRSACVAIPAAFRKNVQSTVIKWAYVASGGAARRTCSQIVFHTEANCKGQYYLTIVRMGKLAVTKIPLISGTFAKTALSMQCK